MTSLSSDCCYLCNECSSSFTTLSCLEEHLLSVHGKKREREQDMEHRDLEQRDMEHSPSSSDLSDEIDKPDGRICRLCSLSFDTQLSLSSHISLAHRDRPLYECRECGDRFAVKRELATHARVHSGEQPHACDQCGKTFGTRQLLKKHCMWHTGERTHVCPTCNKAFFQKGHLTQHLMIHKGGRPHQCNLCQKTFIFKFDLNRHMKIHAERGFACRGCGRSFLKQSSLDEHLLKCKGSRVTPIKEESPKTPPALFGGLPGLLPFSQDELTKMAQNLLSQPRPTTQFCFLCSQHFLSPAAFALHVSTAHFPLVKKEDDELAPIKTDNADTATNSSCASSPQKVSPGGVSPMDDAPSPFSQCVHCDEHLLRIARLEKELESAQAELASLRRPSPPAFHSLPVSLASPLAISPHRLPLLYNQLQSLLMQ